MRVVYFRGPFMDWGYRVKRDGTNYMAIGFATKRGAMRDYRSYKKLMQKTKGEQS